MGTLLHLLKAEKRRRSLWAFCQYVDPDFFAKRPFLQKAADAMQRLAEGKTKRTAICLPPRAGKSRITTIFITWMIGKYPTGSVMRNCCTAKLYNKLSYDARELMSSDAFKETFPGVNLADDKQSLDGWNTSTAKQVSYFGAGVGGTVIGFGASLLAVTDDLFKSMEDGLSETVQDSTFSWYSGTHRSRIEKDCPELDIGTRWTKRDIIGKNIESNYYDEIVIISALDANDETFCSDVKSTEEYRHIRRTVPSTIWNAEFQQEPIEATGTLFVKSELNRFSLKTLKARLAEVGADGKPIVETDARFGYIDVADEGDDHLAFPVGYIIGKDVFITDFVFSQDTIDNTAPMCAEKINTHALAYTRVETNNQGGGFKRELHHLGIPQEKLLKVNNVTNKHTRILMEYGFIKENFHFIQADELELGCPYDLALEQICDYPKAGRKKRVDAPDALAGLSKFTRSMLPHVFAA